MKLATYLGLVSFLALATAACGGGSGEEGGEGGEGGTSGGEVPAQYAGPIQSEDTAHGEQVFQQACAPCHDSGPDLHDVGLSAGRIRQQIREGGGNMPAINATRLSDEDVEAVLAYLVTINAATT